MDFIPSVPLRYLEQKQEMPHCTGKKWSAGRTKEAGALEVMSRKWLLEGGVICVKCCWWMIRNRSVFVLSSLGWWEEKLDWLSWRVRINFKDGIKLGRLKWTAPQWSAKVSRQMGREEDMESRKYLRVMATADWCPKLSSGITGSLCLLGTWRAWREKQYYASCLPLGLLVCLFKCGTCTFPPECFLVWQLQHHWWPWVWIDNETRKIKWIVSYFLSTSER